MSILWTLLAATVRVLAWLAKVKEVSAEEEYKAKALAVLAEAEKKPGNGSRTLTTALEDAERSRRLARLIDARDRVEAKWERRKRRAEKLTRLHKWLSQPRTLAGWVAGATALPATAGAAWLGGVDVPAWVVWIGERMREAM